MVGHGIQAIRRRFEDFKQDIDDKLDATAATLQNWETRLADFHADLHEELSDRIDDFKQDIDAVWNARTAKLRTIAQDLENNLTDLHQRRLADHTLLENRYIRAMNEANTGLENVIRQAGLCMKESADTIRQADSVIVELRSMLTEAERLNTDFRISRCAATQTFAVPQIPVPDQAPLPPPPPAPPPPSPPAADVIRRAAVMASPRVSHRRYDYSPGDEKALRAQVAASERVCQDVKRSPSIRRMGTAALREGLERLYGLQVRGRSPARRSLDSSIDASARPRSDEETLTQLLNASMTLKRLEEASALSGV